MKNLTSANTVTQRLMGLVTYRDTSGQSTQVTGLTSVTSVALLSLALVT